MTVELIFDADCPHIETTRRHLRQALSAACMPTQWTEWERSSINAPPYVRSFGSPSVLVDGVDVAGEPGRESAGCCRIYGTVDGRPIGAPSAELIHNALPATATSHGGAWTRSLAIAPGVLISLLPKLACPICWPAYAGLLTTLGMGFLMSERYLFELTAAFLLLSVAALVYRNQQRRGMTPALIGFLAAAIVLAGKFQFESTSAIYAGLGMLIAASIWNSWPAQASVPCPQCVPSGDELIQLTAKRR